MAAWWVAACAPLKKIYIVGGPAGLGLTLVTRAKAPSQPLSPALMMHVAAPIYPDPVARETFRNKNLTS
jgi:hypothetical protein